MHRRPADETAFLKVACCETCWHAHIRICWDDVSAFQLDHISWHQLLDIHF